MERDPIHLKNTSDTPANIQPASTVVLLRDPFQVFMVQRELRQDFLAGACVFPGGKMDVDDKVEDLIHCITGFDGKQARVLLQEPELDECTALGLFIAAIRELFEEAGILLAYTSDGRLLNMSDDNIRSRFNEYRVAIHDKKLSLLDLAGTENLTYAVDVLLPFSHWITPEAVRKRFDTRFFLARLPGGQKTDYDQVELMGYEWRTPDVILEQNYTGKILMIPPTLKTIEELSSFESIEKLFSHARSRRIYPILPEAYVENESVSIKLPHDPEYSIEAYKQPPSPDDPSRIVFSNGIWRTTFPDPE